MVCGFASAEVCSDCEVDREWAGREEDWRLLGTGAGVVGWEIRPRSATLTLLGSVRENSWERDCTVRVLDCSSGCPW